MKITDEIIKQRHSEWLKETDLGNYEELSVLNEKLRALYVLQTTDGSMKPAAALSLYMVRQEIAKEILAEFGAEFIEEKNLPSRREKYSSIQEWCSNNVHAHVTTKQLAEIGNISYPTALKYISDRPDVFWKVGRGTYEVRNPSEDRKKEKG